MYALPERVRDVLSHPHFPWRVFVIDTETTGFRGCIQYHKYNELLQLFCYDLLSGEFYERKCRPEFAPAIPEKSTECHRILWADVENEEGPGPVLDGLISFVAQHKGERRVLMIAHNAPFDREILLKSIRGRHLGIDAHRLEWHWLDTLHEIKARFPNLKRKYWPREGPHKLETLVKEFKPTGLLSEGSAHNASTDVYNLSALFVDVLWPLMLEFREDGAPWLRFDIYPRDATAKTLSGGGYTDPRIQLVRELSGFGEYRTLLVYNEVFNWFQANHFPQIYRVPIGMFKVYHVFLYALTKFGRRSVEGEMCTFKGICMEVELLLRRLKIADDGAIMEMCKAVLGVTSANDFVNHMSTVHGEKGFYPVLRGRSENWIGFDIGEYEAMKMYKEMGIGSLHELFVEYNFRVDIAHRVKFLEEVAKYLPIEKGTVGVSVMEAFKAARFL